MLRRAGSAGECGASSQPHRLLEGGHVGQQAGGRLEQREGAVADRLSWKRRFAVLENGVLSYYPNEALSQEVKNEMFVKKRKQEEEAMLLIWIYLILR